SGEIEKSCMRKAIVNKTECNNKQGNNQIMPSLMERIASVSANLPNLNKKSSISSVENILRVLLIMQAP
ncbi:MAG: hypothetical protein ABL925_14295, partial [Methylococcales bacterium]